MSSLGGKNGARRLFVRPLPKRVRLNSGPTTSPAILTASNRLGNCVCVSWGFSHGEYRQQIRLSALANRAGPHVDQPLANAFIIRSAYRPARSRVVEHLLRLATASAQPTERDALNL